MKSSRNNGHFCRPVIVEAIELIKSNKNMINCELFSHIYFVTSPITALVHVSIHSVNLDFGSKAGSKTKCWACYFNSGLVRASK